MPHNKSATDRGAAKDFGPHEKNLDRAPNTAESFFILIYIKSCAFMVF